MTKQQFNIPFAYWVNKESGIFNLSLKGNEENRIDNISIIIDEFNILTATFENHHYRYNDQHTYWEFEFDDDKDDIYYSDYEIENVLPEYVETKVQNKYKSSWFSKEKKVIKLKEYQIVKKGIIRLNKPIEKKCIMTNNWQFEKPLALSNSEDYHKINYNPLS